jgi:WD40 repeat protein
VWDLIPSGVQVLLATVPIDLRWSFDPPDGRQLAVSTWDAPLAVFDLASGKALWKVPRFGKVKAAFSPCGRWLATAAAVRGSTEWLSSVWCFDASTGHEMWSAPLGRGSDASIAWAPEGETLLGAASEWAYSPDGDHSGTASLAFLSPEDGRRIQEVPWQSGIDAVAVAPSGARIALCSKVAIVVLDRYGAELARGTGGQESLVACVFIDEEDIVAVGRDVNSGPALLSLSVG